jgi:2-phospho-L-lactate/phosphoenolpyruvate guanylyltransferase
LKISNKTAIIIPIKKFEKSKTRLSSFLSLEERQHLTYLLILDTLEKVIQLKNSQTIVVSSEILHLPDKFDDVVIINEDSSSGVNNAIELANKFIEDHHPHPHHNHDNICFSESIILPIDLPLFSIEDLQDIISYSRKFESCVCIVPSKRYDGTNLLLRKPNSVINTFYDNNSFYNHVKDANKKKKSIIMFNFPSLMLDLDTFEDALELLHICNYKDDITTTTTTSQLKKAKITESKALSFLNELVIKYKTNNVK